MPLHRMLPKALLASLVTGLTKLSASAKNTSGSCSILRSRRFTRSTCGVAVSSPTRHALGSWAMWIRTSSSAGTSTPWSTIPGKMGVLIRKRSVESSRFGRTRALTWTTNSSGAPTGPAFQSSIGRTRFAATGRWGALWPHSLTSPSADSWSSSSAGQALSEKTVSTYRNRMLVKLGLKSTADLIRYAALNHLPD